MSKKKKDKIKMITTQDVRIEDMSIKKIDSDITSLQFLILDDKKLFLITEKSPREYTGTYINDEEVVKIFSDHFEYRWSN